VCVSCGCVSQLLRLHSLNTKKQGPRTIHNPIIFRQE
jgi:hypothetical protein